MRRTKRIAAGITAGLGAALALPAFAAAAATNVTINSTNQQVTVSAANSSVNNVFVSADIPGALLLVTDSSAGITTNDPPCVQQSASVVACPLGAVNKLTVTLGNRNDRATVDGTVPVAIDSTLDGGSDSDVLISGLGNDTLTGSSGADFEQGGPGSDTFRGGSSSDTASYQDHMFGVSATIGGRSGQDGNGEDGPFGGADTVNSDIETLVGSNFNDFLQGDKHGQTLVGVGGADFLLGLEGNDTLLGGDGDDYLVGNTGDDFVRGDAGVDIMYGNRDNDRLQAFDGERDASLRCGPGRFDKLFRDRIDPRGRSCKRHRRHRHRVS